MVWITNPHRFGGGPFAVDAVNISAGNLLTRASNFAGITDSKVGIISYWARFTSLSGIQEILAGYDTGTGGYPSRFFQSGTDIRWEQVSVPSTTASSMTKQPSGLVITTWYHILGTWDTNLTASFNISELYITNADATASGFFSSGNDVAANYSVVDRWALGADPFNNTGRPLSAAVAEFYFAPGQWIDIHNATNRAKFISALNKPVSLGATGSLPTGTAPVLFLHLDDGEAPANFAINRGTGGNMTVNGTLSTSATSPSD